MSKNKNRTLVVKIISKLWPYLTAVAIVFYLRRFTVDLDGEYSWELSLAGTFVLCAISGIIFKLAGIVIKALVKRLKT